MAHKEGPQETSDVSSRDAGRFAAGLLLVVALVCAGTYWYMNGLGGDVSRAAPGAPPPEPRLQADENSPEEVARLNRAWDVVLGSYDWVDRKRGVVRVPIDRAVELYLKKELRKK